MVIYMSVEEECEEEYKYRTVRIIMYTLLLMLAIIMLGIYGIELAKLGIDSEIAMSIGGVLGGAIGYGVKELIGKKNK